MEQEKKVRSENEISEESSVMPPISAIMISEAINSFDHDGSRSVSRPSGSTPFGLSYSSWAEEQTPPTSNEISSGFPTGIHPENTELAAANASLFQNETKPSASSVEERLAKIKLEEDANVRMTRLRVKQANANSHLYSAKTFGELDVRAELLRGVYAMGFEKPSSIQEMALPMIIGPASENLIAQAQSGSGKTVAFCLGLLSRVDTTIPHTQALVLTPTRELAVQCVEKTLLPMAQFLSPPLHVMMALAGLTLRATDKIMDQVVVGTPGKVEELIKRRLLNTRTLKVFVLDEADQMLAGVNSGFGDNCKRIKSQITVPHQSLLFSATFPKEVIDFAKTIIAPPINEIRLASDEELVLEEITQLWVDLRRERRDIRTKLLQDLYSMLQMGQSIIFCRTRQECDAVTAALKAEGFNCSNLHGQLQGFERDVCMDEFRRGKNKVLITTNVLARGVDVPAVTLVVNYDMPVLHQTNNSADFESYLHRIGRTGRFGRTGVAINFVHDDASYNVLQDIEKHFSPHKPMIQQAPLDIEELEKMVSVAFNGIA